MSDEHIRLVAKVQHFYEMMLNINDKIINKAIIGTNSDRNIASEKAEAICDLIEEYEKAFESFLYREAGEKR